MNNLSTDLISLLYALLPGFVAAWVYHSLTAHRKDLPFERVVHALIYTVIIQVFVILFRDIYFVIGRFYSFGTWSEDSALVNSLVVAVLFGLISARYSNNGAFHLLLRNWGWTRRTSHPSEWYSAFSRELRWIILHLKGGRRLYGWPEEWPDHPDRGQFVIDQPEWLLDDGQRAPSMSKPPLSSVQRAWVRAWSNHLFGIRPF